MPVHLRTGAPETAPEGVDAHEIRLVGPGISAVALRSPLALTVRAAHGRGEEVVHPMLARMAAATAGWWGREAFQAAVVAGAEGGLAVAGGTGAGKSTLAASAVLAGALVPTDEVAVVADGDVLAGAATAAVRRDAAALVGLPDGLRSAWAGDALLLPLGAAPRRTPLRGWVHLAWGSSVALRPLGAGARLGALGAVRLHGDRVPDAAAFLRLAALPAWRLERPRTPDGHAGAVDALLRLVG